MESSKKRLGTVIGGMLILLLSGMMYFLLVKPAYKEVQALRSEKESRHETLVNEQETLQEIKRINEKYSALPRVKETFAAMVPNGEDTPSLINQIQSMAKVYSTKIDSITLQYGVSQPEKKNVEPSALKPVAALRVGLAVKGSYEGIKSFISALETNIRIMDLVSFRVNETSSGGSTQYNLTFDTYYQR